MQLPILAADIGIVRILELENTSVVDIIQNDLRSAAILREFGVDYSMPGRRSLGQMCEDQGVDPRDIEIRLSRLSEAPIRPPDFENMSLTALTDHVENTHHTYVKNAIPTLSGMCTQAEEVCKEGDCDIEELKYLWKSISVEQLDHMMKEELALFPYIRNLDRNEIDVVAPAFGSITKTISMMESEHIRSSRDFRLLYNLTNKYQAPESAHKLVQGLFKRLKEFDNKVHLHTYIENNFLFPSAVELERKLGNR